LFLQGIAITGLFIFGGLESIVGDFTVGMLMAAYLLLLGSLQPIARLVNSIQLIEGMEIQLGSLDDVLKQPIDVAYERPGVLTERSEKLTGRLQFVNVTFGYSIADPAVIVDLSLDLEPGKRIALVGPSGCGKSTVARLACGLYQPWKGEVLYDGVPFMKTDREQLARSIAVVDQEIIIFEGSVWDNLTLWDQELSEEELIHAAKIAEFHDIVLARDDLGYRAPLLEGGRNLSGGQRQLLEIARALVRRPSLLIMDEATSSLDSETEDKIAQNLRNAGYACLMIAHRLSTIRDCDEIIVLDQGKVVMRGTHDALKERPGLYRDLIQSETSRHA
jgi:ABC-type bacteriocin/lantibiotic exporter with double-glycine peptidase domain